MSWTEDDEDLYEPPKGPSPREVRAGWAKNGDVEPLWRLLADSPWDRIDREDVVKLLFQALEVRSRADPARFAADVMGRMTVFVTTLMMRSHLLLAAAIEQDGRAVRMRARPPGDLPRVAVESLIPRTLELQEHLASLLAAQASVARQWGLVSKNKPKADRGEVQASRNVKGKRRAKSTEAVPSAVGADGHPENRLAALLNGHGPGAHGSHHGKKIGGEGN